MIRALHLFVLGVALAAAASPAMAQSETIHWTTDWEAAKAEAKARNVPILWTLQQDGVEFCVAMRTSTLNASQIVNLSRRFVNVVAHGGRNHKEKTTSSGRVCSLYPGLKCANHATVTKQTRRIFGNIQAMPTTILATPDGKELFRLLGNPGPTQLSEKMLEAINHVGPGCSLDKWRASKTEIDRADHFLTKGETAKAIKIYRTYATSGIPGLKIMGEAGVTRANAEGQRATDEVMKDAREVLRHLKRLANRYQGTDAGKRANDAAKDFEKTISRR